MENFSSCCNKSYPSWHEHWPALIERRLDLTIMFESTALGSVLLFLYSTVEMQCWWCKMHARERKRLNLCEYLATPCRVTMNISWADFKTAPIYLFNSHGGICGRGVFNISVLGTYFLWSAIYPVYVCSLTCLSLLSTVEKDYRYLHTQKKNK